MWAQTPDAAAVTKVAVVVVDVGTTAEDPGTAEDAPASRSATTVRVGPRRASLQRAARRPRAPRPKPSESACADVS
jgi:hypothetical protein